MQQSTTESLGDEVAPLIVGVGARQPPTGDGHHRRAGRLRNYLAAVDAPVGQRASARRLDDEVGAGEAGPQPLGPVVPIADHHAALVGVEVGEPGGLRPPGRIAPRRLDLDHICPQVGEHLPAPLGSNARAHLDHSKIAERLPHVSTPTAGHFQLAQD